MKNTVKGKLVSAKNTIVENKTKILGAVAVVAATFAVLQQIGIQQTKAFLEEHGLTDEYFTPDED